MSDKGEKPLEEAPTLPYGERADLAATLLESLDAGEDAGVEEAWADEIKRRMEVESGKAKTIPWSETRERILRLRDARRRT